MDKEHLTKDCTLGHLKVIPFIPNSFLSCPSISHIMGGMTNPSPNSVAKDVMGWILLLLPVYIHPSNSTEYSYYSSVTSHVKLPRFGANENPNYHIWFDPRW
jgi:hypothetical protein